MVSEDIELYAMTNGLNVNISKEEFTELSVGDQLWMTFKGIEKIDQQGCNFGRVFHKKESWSKIVVFGGAFGGALGTAIGVWAFIAK